MRCERPVATENPIRHWAQNGAEVVNRTAHSFSKRTCIQAVGARMPATQGSVGLRANAANKPSHPILQPDQIQGALRMRTVYIVRLPGAWVSRNRPQCAPWCKSRPVISRCDEAFCPATSLAACGLISLREVRAGSHTAIVEVRRA
jgi:hypothetical protein